MHCWLTAGMAEIPRGGPCCSGRPRKPGTHSIHTHTHSTYTHTHTPHTHTHTHSPHTHTHTHAPHTHTHTHTHDLHLLTARSVISTVQSHGGTERSSPTHTHTHTHTLPVLLTIEA